MSVGGGGGGSGFGSGSGSDSDGCGSSAGVASCAGAAVSAGGGGGEDCVVVGAADVMGGGCAVAGSDRSGCGRGVLSTTRGRVAGAEEGEVPE